VMSGLMRSTKSERMMILGTMLIFPVKLICDHRSTKNMTIKKSLNGLTLLVISYLKVELERHIPAISVPNSMPNQR
jgi:hypothetical protein